MHSVTIILLLTAVEAQIAKLGYQKVPSKLGVPPPSRFSQPQPRLDSLPKTSGFPAAAPSLTRQWHQTQAESADAPQAVAAQATPVETIAGKLNIYGEQLEKCADEAPPSTRARNYDSDWFIPGGSKGFGQGLGGLDLRSECTYTSDSPKICVSVDAMRPNALGLKRFGKTGPRCMSIWALSTSAFAKGSLFGAGDFGLQCGSLPADVLESEYSMDQWSNLESRTRNYLTVHGRVSPIPDGIHWVDTQTVTVNDQSIFHGRVRSQALRFRKAIKNICKVCSAEATSDGAKATLMKKCEAFTEDDDLELRTIESREVSISKPRQPAPMAPAAPVLAAKVEEASADSDTHITAALALAASMFLLISLKLLIVRSRRSQDLQEPLVQ